MIHALPLSTAVEDSPLHGLKSTTIHDLGLLFMSTLGEIFLTAKDSELFYRLTGAQKKIILFLALRGSQRMSEISHMISSSSQAASSIVDRLQASGLVLRRRDPEDRRAVLVDLADEGRLAYAEMVRVRCARLEHLLEAMTPPTRDEFIHHVNRLQDIVTLTARRATGMNDTP
jgi:DNA-binding MarR family transcriptional regulator